jgi:uncharacterized BrkB/YihY/UPF0761 family membrane protein
MLHWQNIWLGGLMTTLFFAVGKTLIGLYLGKSSVGSAYGAAGSVIVLIVWVYCSTQLFLFEAGFTVGTTSLFSVSSRASSSSCADTISDCYASRGNDCGRF